MELTLPTWQQGRWLFSIVYDCTDDLIPGDSLRFHLAVADCVLLAAGRNHSADVAGGAAAGQVPPLHHGSRHPVHLRHCRGPQHPLQVFFVVLACH